MLRRLLITSLLALAACSDRALATNEDHAEGAPIDAIIPTECPPPPQPDPFCRLDCPGYHECRDGVVTTWPETSVPCGIYGPPECPRAETYRCERGCRTDTARVDAPYLEPSAMCEEGRPRQVGDPCGADGDCRPEVATVDEHGNVVNVYLRCDTSAGRCVARQAPVVADWLASCGLAYNPRPAARDGIAETTACSRGVCLYAERDGCLRQGCTARCTSDGDCPMGATCDDAGVCKPGRRHSAWELGLACPPP